MKFDPEGTDGLSFDPDRLKTGGNSGYQAIGLAVLLGAARILLLGYDMQAGPNGEKHWHPDHVGRNPGAGQFKGWRDAFATMLPDLAKAGVEVINCTPNSALTCFPAAELRDCL